MAYTIFSPKLNYALQDLSRWRRANFRAANLAINLEIIDRYLNLLEKVCVNFRQLWGCRLVMERREVHAALNRAAKIRFW